MENTEQKRMFLAVALSAAVLFIFQTFFAPKSPLAELSPDKANVIAVNGDRANKTTKLNPPINNAGSATSVIPVDTNLTSHKVNSRNSSLSLTNTLSINNFKSINTKYDFAKIVGDAKIPFAIEVKVGNVFRPIFFSMTENDNQISGINNEFGINFSGYFDDENRFHYKLNSTQPHSYRLVFISQEKSLDNRQTRTFSFLGNKDVERFNVGDEDEYDGKVNWIGLDFNFHLFAMVFNESKISRIKNKDGKVIIDIVEPTQSFDSYFVFVKKNYDLLGSLGDKLQLSVDFGIFGVIAVPILRGIQFAYKYVHNYGIAIILLTILLRLITFPLYYKSIISMKKMQKVQPELKKLKEKFKDDPQRMQKETMELFKRAGANPLGGCFPMLLQMPIFFAFYQVLYNSVELVNAPFFGWIHDLSVKDPSYVIPVLMAIAMAAQQKLTPTTSADPTQQKLMMLMPLVFGFIMKDLPAGLVLYIFVSTLFGILQQLLVYKVTD